MLEVAGRAFSCDRYAGDELRAERGAREPEGGKCDHSASRGSVVPRHELGQALHGLCDEDDQCSGHNHGSGERANRGGRADCSGEKSHGVIEQLPVGCRFKRSVQKREKPCVEQLQQDQQTKRHAEKRRSHRPCSCREQEQQRDADKSVQRDADECCRSETADLIWSKQSEQYQCAGQSCCQPGRDGMASLSVLHSRNLLHVGCNEVLIAGWATETMRASE